jgi:hypothetical protein
MDPRNRAPGAHGEKRVNDDENNPERELPGARWLGAALEQLGRFAVDRRWPAAAESIRARFDAVPRMESLRERVETARAQSPREVQPRRIPFPEPEPREIPGAEDQPPEAEPEEGRGLDPALRARLERLLRFGLPAIRVYTGTGADRLARRHSADAVTVRNEIHFRQGAYDPATPRGLGLLAHEATHVAWDGGARTAARRTQGLDPAQAEERTALDNERRILHADAHPAGRRPLLPAPPPPLPAPPARSGVRTAQTSRDLSQPEAPPAQAAQLSDAQLRALRHDIHASLLDKLRTDFERGA